MLEQKLAEAKANRRERFINLTIGFVTITLLCSAAIFFIAVYQNKSEKKESLSANLDKEQEKTTVVVSQPLNKTVPDDNFRQSYIDVLNDYENNIKPELNKIDLIKWDKLRSENLARLQEEALSKFSVADYSGALKYIEELHQLAQKMIADSQRQFIEAFTNAKDAYDTDSYDDAKYHIAKALMLNKQSEDAVTLSNKIDTLPDILSLLGNANTARVENNHEKELGYIEDIIKLVPDRESAIDRKQELIDIINNENFKSNIVQSYQAIEKGNAERAKQKLVAAKKIYPNKQEIVAVTTALQELEKKQRLEKYQQVAETAITSDDWVTVKQQLELALQERPGDKNIQKSLAEATMIITLNNELDNYIANPYRLTNEQVSLNAKNKLTESNTYVDISPSLNKKADTLTHLVKSMNNKVSVEVISDNQTNIIVRGVGVVGITKSKIIQLKPGHYQFEGKREGFKSKLINVLIPYDKTSYRLTVICDELI